MSDYDDLLAETLKDFEDDLTSGQQPVSYVTQGNPQEVRTPALPPPVHQHAHPSPSKHGGGPSLPPRHTKPKGLAFDPLKKGSSGSRGGAVRGVGAGMGSDAQSRQLPPEIQKLADELVKLVEESGIGPGDQGGTGPLSNAAFDRLLGTASSSAASSTAPHLPGWPQMPMAFPSPPMEPLIPGQPPRQFTSPALQGLAEHTRKVVGEQAGPQAAAGVWPPGPQGAGGDPLADMLAGMFGGEGGSGAVPGSNMIMESVLRNLLSKEVLYTPLKDISAKYPPWLDAQAVQLGEAECVRYRQQYAAIQAVCVQYETDPDNFSELVRLIQAMQEHGEPPAEIVADITSGLGPELQAEPGQGPGPGLGPNIADLMKDENACCVM